MDSTLQEVPNRLVRYMRCEGESATIELVPAAGTPGHGTRIDGARLGWWQVKRIVPEAQGMNGAVVIASWA